MGGCHILIITSEPKFVDSYDGQAAGSLVLACDCRAPTQGDALAKTGTSGSKCDNAHLHVGSMRELFYYSLLKKQQEAGGRRGNESAFSLEDSRLEMNFRCELN